jgi:hypothetical protein
VHFSWGDKQKEKTMRTVAQDARKEVQTAAGVQLDEKLNVPFFIDLPLAPAKDAPGPVWLDQYDLTYLQVVQSGYSNDFQGNQYFWVQFNPIQAGQTQVGFVQQPRLINPLFISLPYTITITA